MRAGSHLLIFRAVLLAAIAAPAVHCGDDSQPSCGCADVPGDGEGDDDSAAGPGDDDSADDDDSAQEDPTLGLPPCEGGVLAAFTLEEIQPPGPDSEGYLVPGEDTLQAISASLTTLVQSGDGGLASAEVAVVGYDLCRGEGDEAGTALWRPLAAGSGRGLFAWRAVDARPLQIGVPRAGSDLLTLEQGAHLFATLRARALIAAGTHPCANAAASGCDGTTSACGAQEEPFRVSDMAHSADTVFQVAQELMADMFETDQVLSLNGMDGDGFSVSNGTVDPTSGGTPEALLAQALGEAWPDEVVTTCNEFPGADVDVRACGETNVQGRYVNGSAAPCFQGPPSPSHRFWHLAQSMSVREDPQGLAEVLESVLP